MAKKLTFLCVIWLSLYISLSNCENIINGPTLFVNPNVILQDRFEGWGTSLAWWADMVGGMEPDIVDHIVNAVFSPSKLNLNILRYVIGGTTPNNYTCGEYRDGAASESFKDGPSDSFIWDRDLRQRKILLLAKEEGANVFEAFSNTPPQWMTRSGCSKGNPRNAPLHPNFDSSNAPDFANYATEVIKHFHEVLNVTFTTYSPFNEPFGLHGIGSWAGEIQQQEGCNMDRATMVEVIKSMHTTLVFKNLTFVKLAISDETQVNTQIQSYDYFKNAGVSNLFSQVNVHGYWDNIELSRKDLLSLKCAKGGQELWMDEMGWDGTPIDNMEQGLNLAKRIISDLRSMLPSAWVYWQVVEDIGGWGLIEVPYTNTSLENIQFNSGYYAMEQFSQHIKQGYKLIFTSHADSIAAFSEKDKKMVIVTINYGNTEILHEIDLTLLDSPGSVSLHRTSPTEQHLNIPPPSITPGKTMQVALPPLSVSTLEFSNVTTQLALDNLILNGNFETVRETEGGILLPTSWTAKTEGGNGIERSKVTTDDAWRGDYSGLLELGPSWNPSLLQNFTLEGPANANCSLYLSAWCSSTHAGTLLEVEINQNQTQSIEINRSGAYSMYGLSFSAEIGAEILISFKGGRTVLLNGAAKIDNISLHAKC